MARKQKTASAAPEIVGYVSDQEARFFRDIVRKHPDLPEGVRRVELRFADDSTGAPAVWIVFRVKDELKPDMSLLRAIRKIGNEMRADIHRIGSERWPYVKIRAE